MAIDPSPSHRAVAGDLPPDENVVPTYRAIAPSAIASLVLGLASILTFLWPYFAALGALAIVSGILAIRSIRRLPDALTGERMANAGIALGLLFSLAALTLGGVQNLMIRRSAASAARAYLEAIRSGSVEQALYYHALPEGRKGKSPREVLDEMRQGMGRPGQLEMETADTRAMIDRLKSSSGQTVELGRVTDFYVDGMNPYLEYLVIFRGPKTEKFPSETQYGGIRLLGIPEGRGYAWRVQSAKFPLAEKPGGY